MIKYFLAIPMVFALFFTVQAQVSYGLKAGVNLGKYTNGPPTQSVNTLFYVSGYTEIPLGINFSIQPGVSLQGKGSKYSVLNEIGRGDEAIKTSIDYTINIMSIEIPVNAMYYIPTGDSGEVFIGAGPYIGFNVYGVSKGKGEIIESLGGVIRSVESIEESIKAKFSGSDKDMNLIDAGLNFMLGYKFSNGFLLNGGYSLGLTNLDPNSSESISPRVWQFGVGFQF